MKRLGRSVLAKNVLSVSLLVAVVVATLSIVDLRETLRLYEQSAQREEADGVASMRRQGTAIARKLGVSLAPLVSDNAFVDVQELANTTASDDEATLYVLVLGEEGQIIAQSGQGEFSGPVPLLARQQAAPEPTEIDIGGVRGLRFVAPLLYSDVYYGEVWIAISRGFLDARLAAIQQEKQAARDNAIRRSVVFGGLALLLGLVLALLQSFQITRPVRQLAHRATQIAAGDLSARVQLKSRDEFGQLGETFNNMAERINDLLQETAEKVNLQNEMEIARNVQDRLVAPSDLIQRGNLQFAGYYQPASFCGGDFWNYFDLTPDRTLLIIADVTGHGVPSALLTATAKSCADTLQAVAGEDLTVPQFMQTLNYVIFEAAKRHLQMTCFATLLDFKKGELTYASAGHPMPYRCRLQGDKYTLQTLIARGNRLGDLPEWDFPAYTTDIQTGDVLIWFTDGITEGESPEGEQWGEKRLRRTLQRNAHRTPEQLRDHIVKSAFEFYANRPPGDDLTLVVGKAV